MKKVLFAAVALATLAFAGMGSAQKFSIYSGYPLGIGGMYYLSENLRVDATLAIVPGGFGFGAGVDYIIGKIPVVEKEPFPINFYYGAGGSGAFASAFGVGVFGVGVSAFGGFEYRFSEGLGLFSEFGAGPVMAFGPSGSAFSFDYLGRFGLNFY